MFVRIIVIPLFIVGGHVIISENPFIIDNPLHTMSGITGKFWWVRWRISEGTPRSCRVRHLCRRRSQYQLQHSVCRAMLWEQMKSIADYFFSKNRFSTDTDKQRPWPVKHSLERPVITPGLVVNFSVSAILSMAIFLLRFSLMLKTCHFMKRANVVHSVSLPTVSICQ